MTPVTSTKKVTGESNGRVMRVNFCQAFAPSIAAAS